nr:hypothetical protein HmN_000148000 [Hymenolepis microstoma]
MVPMFKVVSGDFAVEDRHSGGGEKVVEDAELEANYFQCCFVSFTPHLAHWHTAWLTSTSARMKKRKIGSSHGSYQKMGNFSAVGFACCSRDGPKCHDHAELDEILFPGACLWDISEESAESAGRSDQVRSPMSCSLASKL